MCSADGMKLRKLSGECQYGMLKKLSKFFMSDLTGEKLGLVGGCHGAICRRKKARAGRAKKLHIEVFHGASSDFAESLF